MCVDELKLILYLSSCFIHFRKNYVVYDIRGLKSPSFESWLSLQMIITPCKNYAGAQTIVGNTCFHCRLETYFTTSWISFFHSNRFNCTNINVTKNRRIILMDLLGPCQFNLHMTVGQDGHSMNCGHCTASINCCGQSLMPTILPSSL